MNLDDQVATDPAAALLRVVAAFDRDAATFADPSAWVALVREPHFHAEAARRVIAEHYRGTRGDPGPIVAAIVEAALRQLHETAVCAVRRDPATRARDVAALLTRWARTGAPMPQSRIRPARTGATS